MDLSETILAAGRGWSKILSGKPDWREHFAFDARTINLGFLLYLAAAALSVVALGLRIGLPAPQTMLALVAGYVLPVLALILTSSLARRLFKLSGPVTEFYVPGLMILALMAFIGALTLLVGIPLWGAILAMTGVLLFRLGRACGLDLGPAIAYGLVNFLAGLPFGLYMMGGAFAVAT